MFSFYLPCQPRRLTLEFRNNCKKQTVHFSITLYIIVTNLGVIWLDSHNFLLWSHGRLLSMKSLVRVLPAAAYTFNMVPIYDPGGPNPHGRVWETFPVPVRDFTPRSHYPREAGLPKPDFRSRTLIRRRTHSELGYLPIRLKSTRSYSLNQSVHY